MEAAGSGALLRRDPIGPRLPAGDAGPIPARARPARLKMANVFTDQGHLRYSVTPPPPAARCGAKKGEKRRMRLVKGLEKDLTALNSMSMGFEKDQISEAADALLAQLTKLRAEAKEMRKQEKAAMKAAKAKDSSSESSDSECETAVKMRGRRRAAAAAATADPIAAGAVQTQKKESMERKIEVCMGGKCKKLGAVELMAELEKEVRVEGAVVGCKCMGKCRDGPNVRVVNRRADDVGVKAAKGAFCCVGVGGVGPIVADCFSGDNKDLGLLAA